MRGGGSAAKTNMLCCNKKASKRLCIGPSEKKGKACFEKCFHCDNCEQFDNSGFCPMGLINKKRMQSERGMRIGIGVSYIPCECLFQVPLVFLVKVSPIFLLPSVYCNNPCLHRSIGQYKS